MGWGGGGGEKTVERREGDRERQRKGKGVRAMKKTENNGKQREGEVKRWGRTGGGGGGVVVLNNLWPERCAIKSLVPSRVVIYAVSTSQSAPLPAHPATLSLSPASSDL